MIDNNALKIFAATGFILIFTMTASRALAESYVVHISSYQGKAHAIIDKELLEADGYSVVVKAVDLGSKGTWYRVLIGPYADYDQAGRAADEVIHKKFVTYARVMPYCGFEFISKKNKVYTAQCVGGNYDGNVFKIRPAAGGFRAVPYISTIRDGASGLSREAAGYKACGCRSFSSPN